MVALQKPGIEDYAASKTEREPDYLIELRKETQEKFGPMAGMMSGHVQGRFLKQMVAITGAQRVLEIGTFVGYSALCLAEGLSSGGELITCEINPEAIAIAKKYFLKTPLGNRINLRQGPALETIDSLEPEFDLVFIDADKENYLNYYNAVLPKVRFGGVILVDNVLWDGKVLNPQSETDKAICKLNDYVIADDRVEPVLLTIRDGVMLLRKK